MVRIHVLPALYKAAADGLPTLAGQGLHRRWHRHSRVRPPPRSRSGPASDRGNPRHESADQTGAGIAKFSARIYRISLTKWGWLLAVEVAAADAAGPDQGPGREPPLGGARKAAPRMLLARPRHASVRSLERYVRPGVDAVARHVAESP
ncbi:hypothetical protein ACFV1X_37470 [Streptomyces coelicoflavus]|uniref:hypothetical protein n=1 Tax=Streptomyces coelicoflavus TaxID=285562 RepID=UPI00369B1407